MWKICSESQCREMIHVVFALTINGTSSEVVLQPRGRQVGVGGAVSLTEGGPCFGPRHRRHDDEAEAFVLAAADLHVVGLQGGRHGGRSVEGLRGGGGGSYRRNHGVAAHSSSSSAAPSPSSAADAGGGAAAGADGVEGVLAALRGALPYLLRQAGRLGAAVVGGCRRWGHVSFCFSWRQRRRIKRTAKSEPRLRQEVYYRS